MKALSYLIILTIFASCAVHPERKTASVQENGDQLRVLAEELVGEWKVSNCSNCFVKVRLNPYGVPEGDMEPWNYNGTSYSGGFRPMPVITPDSFIYRGDIFERQGAIFVNTNRSPGNVGKFLNKVE